MDGTEVSEFHWDNEAAACASTKPTAFLVNHAESKGGE
jgi:hypothetical protein